MSGIVEEAGPGVTAFQPGDEVYGMVGGVAGLQGTLAKFICADADLLAHKPKTLSMREAAALPLITITAWEGLVDRARVHATVSTEKRRIVEGYGATPIDYRKLTVDQYVAANTANGDGFDIVYDTVGGATLDASFLAVKRYTGHVLSCLGWTAHSLAPLSFRGATYSGVFTLLPLLTGKYRAHHGQILAQAAALADAGKLKPLLTAEEFSPDQLEDAFAAVESGSTGKVVLSLFGNSL